MKRSSARPRFQESHPAARPRRLAVEALESRQLLSAGPHLPDLGVFGPRERLDAASAAGTMSTMALEAFSHPAADVGPFAAGRAYGGGPFDGAPSLVVIDLVAAGPAAPPAAPSGTAGATFAHTIVGSVLTAASGAYVVESPSWTPFVVVIDLVSVRRIAPPAVTPVAVFVSDVDVFQPPLVLVAMTEHSPARAAARTIDSPSDWGAPSLSPPSPARGVAASSPETTHPQDGSNAAAISTRVTSQVPPTDSGLPSGSLILAASGMTEPTPARSSGPLLDGNSDPCATTPSSLLGVSGGTLTRPVDDGQRSKPAADYISPPLDDGFVDLSPNKSRSGEATRLTADNASSSSPGQRRTSESESASGSAAWSDPASSRRLSAARRSTNDMDTEELSAAETHSAAEAIRNALAGRLNLELSDDGGGGGMVVIDAGGESPAVVAAHAAPVAARVRDNGAGNGVPMDAACGQLQAFELAGPSLSAEGPDADVAAAPLTGPSSDGPADTSAAPAAPEASAAADSSPDTDYRRATLVPGLLLLVVQHFFTKSRSADRPAAGFWPALAKRWKRLWRKWQTRRQ